MQASPHSQVGTKTSMATAQNWSRRKRPKTYDRPPPQFGANSLRFKEQPKETRRPRAIPCPTLIPDIWDVTGVAADSRALSARVNGVDPRIVGKLCRHSSD